MVFAALVVAASLAAAPPDGTYSYDLQQSGTSIGSATVTLKHADAGILIHEKQDIKLGSSSMNYVVDETLDPGSLAPRSYVATYTKDGTPAVIRMALDSGGVRGSIDGVSGISAVTLPTDTKANFIVELSLLSGYVALPAQVSAAHVSKFAEVVPSQFIAVENHVQQNMNPVRPSGVPAQDVPLSISSNVDYDIWYDPLNYTVHAVVVSTQNVIFKLTKYSAEVKS